MLTVKFLAHGTLCATDAPAVGQTAVKFAIDVAALIENQIGSRSKKA